MTQNIDSISAAAAGTVQLGDLSVNRLGFGAMRLTGKGIWGPPADRNAAMATLRRAVELGVNFIDTADSYGPGISEELIAEALSPYPKGVVVATKGGWERVGPGQWIHNAGPKHLQEAVEGSLERLRLDHIDVYYLHIPDAAVSFDASVGALGSTPGTRQDSQRRALQRYFGALASCPKDCSDRRRAKSLWFCRPRMGLSLDHCQQHGITFVPWAPLGQNRQANQILEEVAKKLGATPLQVALAWLLRRSPVIAPIPGTSSIAHLEENVAAAALKLPDEDFKKLSDIPLTPANYRE